MIIRLPHLFLPTLAVMVLGCSGIRGGDSGWWYEDPDNPRRGGSEYFDPDFFLVHTYAAYEDDLLHDFAMESGNPASSLPPVMMFLFAENRFFATGNEDYACEWIGQMNVEGVDLMDDDHLWLGYAISLDLLETNCYEMDPYVWGESTPTTMLERAFLGIGYGPMSSQFANVIRPLVAETDSEWESEWSPYVFSMYLGLWEDESGGLVSTELNYAFSYEMEDGALTYDQNEEFVPLRLGENGHPPEGLLTGYAFYDLEPEQLL